MKKRNISLKRDLTNWNFYLTDKVASTLIGRRIFSEGINAFLKKSNTISFRYGNP